MTSRFAHPIALHLFLGLFLISALLGVLPAYDANLSLATLLAIALGVALYFAIAALPRSRIAVRRAAVAGLLVSAAFGLYFITQYGYQDYHDKGGIIARIGQLTTLLPNLNGFSPHPNAAAAFMEAALPMGLALALSSRKAAAKAALTAATLVVAYAVLLTASRGSWLGLAAAAGIGLALAAWNRLPRRTATRLIGIGVAAVAAALAAVMLLGPDRLPFLATTFARAADRIHLFQNSLSVLGDYAVTGAGLGDTFAMVYSRYGLLIQVPFLSYTHNLPLSVWWNQGLLGLFAFAGVVVTFYRFVRRVRREAQPPVELDGAWLGVTASLIHGLTDATRYAYGSHWVMPVLFAWLGLAIASGRLALRDAQTLRQPPSRLRMRAIAAAAALTLAALLVVFSRPLLAVWHTNLGALAETRAELGAGLSQPQRQQGFETAIAEFESALNLDPGLPAANRRLGNLLVKLDQFDEAVPPLEAAFRQDPDNPAVVKGLGLAYVWIGNTSQAARLFHRLDDPEAMSNELYIWGNYRTDQRRPLLAAYAYQTAQEMHPDAAEPGVWLQIAESYRAAGRLDAARLWYNRVLDAQPDNARAREALAELKP